MGKHQWLSIKINCNDFIYIVWIRPVYTSNEERVYQVTVLIALRVRTAISWQMSKAALRQVTGVSLAMAGAEYGARK